MRLILNVIWLIFGGLWLALGYLLAALICFVLIITIPFGFAALRIASYALWPFGRTIVDKPGTRPGALIGNVIWVILFGIWLAIGHVVTAVAMAVTIIGIPLALANLKLIPVSLLPLGKEIVPVDDAQQADRSPGMTVIDLGVPSLGPADPAPADGPLVDTFGRIATDLRVSLTDRCNLRCTYCMPAEGLDWMPGDQLLTPAELTRLLRIAVTRLGITSVRFTGGEPLVVKHLEDIVAATASLRPRPEITLTTNGIGLDKRAAKLKQAGLDRINVSLDTVDAAHFTRITRRDRLHDVLAGLQAAKAAGLNPVKVNAVLDPVTGLDDAPELLRFCLDHGYQLRIIEQMPLDAGHQWQRGKAISADDVLAVLRRHFDLTPDSAPRGSAPAELWRVDGRPRTGRNHRLGLARILFGLRPHPPHRGRSGPQLPVRAAGDRSAPTAARGHRRRRPRGGMARGDVGQGGGAWHQ